MHCLSNYTMLLSIGRKKLHRNRAPECDNVSNFLEREGFNQETIDIVLTLLQAGRTVYWGELESSGENLGESYFCCESFLLCDDHIYFNGKISGW